MKEYIHYGHKEFDINSFNKIKNETLWTKPLGGLWASRVDAEYGWKDWCESSGYKKCEENNSFKFTLDNKANVYHIYSVKDLEVLPRIFLTNDEYFSTIDKYLIDFENAVNSGYDAIELHLSEETNITDDVMGGLYYALYPWDCDSILIMNPEIVIPIL